MRAMDPVSAHERTCPVCKRREWCQTVMDLIAQSRGYETWSEMLKSRGINEVTE